MLLITYLNNFKKKITDLITIPNTKLLKNFAIYACGSVLSRSMSFFLLPFTLAMLSPSDFGLLGFATQFNNIAVIFLGCGLRQVVALEYFHYTKQDQQILINRILVLYSCLCLPIVVFLISQASAINYYAFSGNASTSLIILCCIYCFLHFFVELLYQVLQYESKALQYAVLQLCVACTTVVGNVFFLFHGYNVTGIILSSTLALSIVCCIGATYYLKATWYQTVCLKESLYACPYFIFLGLPFIPSMLFAWILAASDRWILLKYTSLHEVGIYNLADTFTSLFQFLILIPLAGTYLPLLQRKYNENKQNIVEVELWNKKIMHIAMATMAVLIVFSGLMLKPILQTFLPLKYHESIRYIWMLLLGNVFLMGSYFSTALIQFCKKKYFLSGALCLPALFNVALNYVLVPPFCIYGCVASTTIAYFLYWVLTIWYNKKLLKKIYASNNNLLLL